MKKSIFLFIVAIFLFWRGASQDLPEVEIQTSFGDIRIEIDTIKAPVTAKNFLEHIEKGTFENAAFYRVVRMDNQPNSDIKIEVIQGGIYREEDFENIKCIQHETTKKTGLKHLNGTLSMARNKPGSASTEFFICVGDQPELDFGGKRNPDGQGFAAFGQVVKGMEVVRKIQDQKADQQTLVEKVAFKVKQVW